MTLARQVALVSAGCQPWNLNIVDAKGSRFAYAATLAIYIFEWNPDTKLFHLESIMSEHKKTITCIAWHPTDKDVLASSSTDYKVCIWHAKKHKLIATLDAPDTMPLLIAWYPSEEDSLAYTDCKGSFYLWRFLDESEGSEPQPLKDSISISSDITQMSWHPSVPGHLAIGHADGTISLYIRGKKPQRHVKLIGNDKENPTDESAISSLLWDPFSPNYLLICSVTGHLQLVDSSVDVAPVITTYSPPSKAVTIKCVAWLKEAPGAFVTGDSLTGVLRIWTVAKINPEVNLRVKQVGFKAICVLPLDDTTETVPTGKLRFRSRIVCLFFDGGVGVYNLRNSTWDFLREMGHLETIFDCQFKPDNCDFLATASFDGTVKVWDINTMEAVDSSYGDASIIYSLSWAPGDSDCLAAATSKSGVFIWSLKKGCIKKLGGHEKDSYIYCVAWNQKDARKIASAGGDGTCMIHQTDGKLVQTFKHPSAVYGCDWNPKNETIIATACEDGNVRIFYECTGTSQPLKVLSGHEGKVFRVKWSPLKDGILCSTSDDCSIRVWHYGSGTTIQILEGHSNYTRGLLWCPELPNILISGSWDSTIRIWDIMDGACLDVIEDHGADVYGLACHVKRPFVFASTSRDSTFRLWSLLPLVSSLYLKILVHRPLSEIFSPSELQVTEDICETFGLYGNYSKSIKSKIANLYEKHDLESLFAISALFCAPTGISNLWDLVFIYNGKEVDFSAYKKGIIHKKHLTKFTISKAMEKEKSKAVGFGSGGMSTCNKEENLHESAECYLLTGNLKKFCELKIQSGQWLQALAVSPGVSMEFWRELCNRWMNVLMQESDEFIAPLCVATNQLPPLVEFYKKQNSLEKAHILSVSASEGLMSSNCSMVEQKEFHLDNKMNDEKFINEAVKCLSERFMLCGLPVKAACHQLADNNIQETLYCLLRGNELELTVSLCFALNKQCSSLKTAVTYLSWRCVQNGEWELAIDVLNLCPDTDIQKAKICINCGLSQAERNLLYDKAGFPPTEECLELADREHKVKAPLFMVVQYYLLSNEPKKGLEIGLKFVKDSLAEHSWRLEPTWQILNLMSTVRSHSLLDISFDRQRFELQVYSAYIGAIVAIRQGYHPVVVPLFSTALSLIQRVHNANLSITEDQVSSELQAWVSFQSSNKRFSEGREHTINELLAKAYEDLPFGDVGVTIVSGSQLPRHSDQHRCYLRGSRIQGPVFFLDNLKSAISLNDALMWAKVNRFSPLKTGQYIIPF